MVKMNQEAYLNRKLRSFKLMHLNRLVTYNSLVLPVLAICFFLGWYLVFAEEHKYTSCFPATNIVPMSPVQPVLPYKEQKNLLLSGGLCPKFCPTKDYPRRTQLVCLSLPEIVRLTMSLYFEESTRKEKLRLTESDKFSNGELARHCLERFADKLPVEARFKKPAAVFVTLSLNGKTRACWGSLYPEYDSVAKAAVFTTLSALTKDYRYSPIQAYEWKKLKPQVTVVKSVQAIKSLAQQNPLKEGLVVRAGGKSGVLLPGEAADAYYQFVQCKLKAGIKPNEPCQLYALKAEIYD